MSSFFTVLLAVFTAIYGFFATPANVNQLIAKGDISGYAEEHSGEKTLPSLNADENGDFTVLQFSDTHFTTGLSYGDVKTMLAMKELTLAYSPDLVVISGDMLDDGNAGAYNKRYVLDSVARLFEELEQYWAYIPGNNDGQNYGTSSDVTAYLSQYAHCLCSDDPAVSGGAQYSLDVAYNGDTVHSLIFIDTMDYDDSDDEHIYGYVLPDQVAWTASELESKNGVPVSVFLHENTPAFREAYERGEPYSQDYATLREIPEKYDIPKNKPLDELFAFYGSVGLLSMGHSHPSENLCSFMDGTYYHVTPQTKVGSTLITVHTLADDTRSMYDFLAV